ncbi:MAG TPA: aminotransferase class V-fold PLP-dependent enzyme [Myxococcales bacterium]|jgi:isopenicillin-N epimerase
MASEFAKFWTLDPGIVFLNHGSFGACPRAVLDAQSELRARMERQPLQFLARDLEGLLDEARAALAEFVGAGADDLAFVPNATAGVNTVVRSLQFEAGDELLTTNHAYNACANALRIHEPRGVKVVVAQVPWPLHGSQEVVEAVMAAVTPRTRLVLLDHITSPTGLVFPVQEMVRRLNDRGIDTLVDGAHAPGMLPLNLRELGAAYYTGNCHKWMCTPKGSALLHVRRDKQASIRPLGISHGANAQRSDRSRFRLEFDWGGTNDPTPYLCIPAALKFFAELIPGGFPEVMKRNHALAVKGRKILCDALDLSEPAPEDMLGSLAAVPLPQGGPTGAAGHGNWHPLQKTLYEKHRIEVPIMVFPAAPHKLVRIAAQLYNDESQVAALASALKHELHPRRVSG